MYAGRIVEYSDKNNLFKNPLHPYTKALFNSLPDMTDGLLIPIEGQPPSIEENILGCPFNPRCQMKMEICQNKNPKIKEKNGSEVACWLNY